MTSATGPVTPAQFYDLLAPEYDELFSAPHRRMYDDLAWDFIQDLLPQPAGTVVDVGCGTGRWSARLMGMGHRVVAVEPAPAMARIATNRICRPDFELIRKPVEDADLDDASADLVLAMGSLQYTSDPRAVLEVLARWVRPGGWVAVLVDSLVALLLELVRSDRSLEAVERLETRTGLWNVNEQQVRQHLFDRLSLESAMRRAGLVDVKVRGLLIGVSAFGRDELVHRLGQDWCREQRLERLLADQLALADFGKQLLGIGRAC